MLTRVHYQRKRADGSGGGRGRRVGGLLRYLFGQGRAEEHVNDRFAADGVGTPYGRLVAASGGEQLADLQPVRAAGGRFDYQQLVGWLEEPVRAAGVLRRVDGRPEGAGWVWHASMRLHPDDRHRVFSDETWAQMAGEMLRGAGLVVDGDDAGVRWVVVRHAADHVHIVATLVREDGRREWFKNDYPRCVDATARVAARMGLRQVRRGRGDAYRRPRAAEVHKAARRGRFTSDGGVLTVRDELRRRVRVAAAAADSAEVFVGLLEQQGVQVAFRASQAHRGQVSGVKFALAGDVTAVGTPVWYGGGRLAPELTWPRLRARWAAGVLPGMDDGALAAGRDRAQVLASAQRVVRGAARRLGHGGAGDAAAVGQAAADCMTAGAWLLDGSPGGGLVAAAERFDAATRQPSGGWASANPDVLRLHALSQALFMLQAAADDDEERQTLQMMYALCVLAERIARLHEQDGQPERASHARAAARGIRAWAGGGLRERGRRLPAAERARLAETVRRVLPQRAGEVLADPAWHALAATLHDIDTRGADVGEALRVAAGWRELRTAESLAAVLVWRLRAGAAPAGADPQPDLAGAAGRTRSGRGRAPYQPVPRPGQRPRR